MFLTLLSLLVAVRGQVAAADDWPTAPAGRILATPNWSDYHIYPAAALKKEQEGQVLPEIRIGRDGKPKACRILSSSFHRELDAGTCKLMMQMEFEPARDASGRPIESHYSRSTVWRLTEEAPFSSAQMRTRLSLEGGEVRVCDIEQFEGSYVQLWAAIACAVFADRSYFFADRANQDLTAIIEVRLDAIDGAELLQRPWPAGTVLAEEKVGFVINSTGDASQCTPIESRGFGRRGLNNLSPCGRLLAAIWFAQPTQPGMVRRGVFETRVIQVSEP